VHALETDDDVAADRVGAGAGGAGPGSVDQANTGAATVVARRAERSGVVDARPLVDQAVAVVVLTVALGLVGHRVVGPVALDVAALGDTVVVAVPSACASADRGLGAGAVDVADPAGSYETVVDPAHAVVVDAIADLGPGVLVGQAVAVVVQAVADLDTAVGLGAVAAGGLVAVGVVPARVAGRDVAVAAAAVVAVHVGPAQAIAVVAAAAAVEHVGLQLEVVVGRAVTVAVEAVAQALHR